MEKTAMQQAIEKLEFVLQMWKDPENEMEGIHSLNVLISDLTELLPTEKQNIIEAYLECACEYSCTETPVQDDVELAEQYYKEKYGTQR